VKFLLFLVAVFAAVVLGGKLLIDYAKTGAFPVGFGGSAK
jgi:hypothetical protein